MTLTQQDLKAVNQVVSQVVSKVVNEVVNEVVSKVVDQKLKKELRPIKKDIKEIKETQNLIIGQFDLRLNHLEKHTTHPPLHASFVTT